MQTPTTRPQWYCVLLVYQRRHRGRTPSEALPHSNSALACLILHLTHRGSIRTFGTACLPAYLAFAMPYNCVLLENSAVLHVSEKSAVKVGLCASTQLPAGGWIPKNHLLYTYEQNLRGELSDARAWRSPGLMPWRIVCHLYWSTWLSAAGP